MGYFFISPLTFKGKRGLISFINTLLERARRGFEKLEKIESKIYIGSSG